MLALWPEKFQQHAELITQALGLKALCVDHVGSTSVPGLAATPIIDIVVVVENSGDEAAYLPALLAARYVLRVREPDWHQHRMLRTPQLDVHVHIFSSGCVEVARMLAFRNRLRSNAEDRLRYAALKRNLAKLDWPETKKPSPKASKSKWPKPMVTTHPQRRWKHRRCGLFYRWNAGREKRGSPAQKPPKSSQSTKPDP